MCLKILSLALLLLVPVKNKPENLKDTADSKKKENTINKKKDPELRFNHPMAIQSRRKART